VSTDVILLIVFVSLALGVSFLCSVLEAVLLSITPAFVAALEKSGSKTAARITKLKGDLDGSLSAILSLNTIAHTVGAAGAGAQAAKIWDDAAMGIFSGVLTILILVFSEIIPKSLGAAHWKRLAGVVSLIMIPLKYSMVPFVFLARGLTRFIGGSGHSGMISREEFSAIAEQGAREGVFPEGEGRVLGNLFRLRELSAADIMTPRTVMFALSEEMTVGELLPTVDTIRFSRLPIHEGSMDKITGYVLKGDVLQRAANGELELPLKELRRELKAIPAGIQLSQLLDRLLEEQSHLVLVVDEYGGTAGLVTLEDLVETLVGIEIVDEADAVTDMQDLARRQWKSRAYRMGLISDVEAGVVTEGSGEH
jgi:CBS domain containing-hemolysin-like protein